MDGRSGELGRGRALYAFRSRDFRLLWSARTVSLIGDGAFLIALGWRTTDADRVGDVARHRAHGQQHRFACDHPHRRRARRPLLAARNDDRLRPGPCRDHGRAGSPGRLGRPLLRPAARPRRRIRRRRRLLLPRRRRNRPACRRVARARLREHVDRHLATGVVRRRPRARGLDLRRGRFRGGLRAQRDHVPRLGAPLAAGAAALVRARAERGHVQVDRGRHPLRRGSALALGRASPSRRSC